MELLRQTVNRETDSLTMKLIREKRGGQKLPAPVITQFRELN